MNVIGLDTPQTKKVLRQIDKAYTTGLCDERVIACPKCNSDLVYVRVSNRKVIRFATCTNNFCNVQIKE